MVKAATRLREASAIFREVDLYRQRSSCVSELAHAAALSGDHAAAEEALAEAQSVRVPSFRMDEYFFGAARAWTAAARGDVTHAARLALETARTCADMGQWLFEALALHDAVRLGEARAALPRLAELAEIVEGDLADTLALHARALSARDSEGLAQISERFEAMGAILYAAEAAAEAAHAAKEAGRRRTSLALALRARNLARRCEGARTPALAELEHPLPLTRRAREMAVLAAQGLSNQEIADRLMVSVRTVEGHLNRAFAKLGVSQRRELGPIVGTGPGQIPPAPS